MRYSHLDRANIGNAKIEGLEASLGMTGTDYNVALAIFCEYALREDAKRDATSRPCYLFRSSAPSQY